MAGQPPYPAENYYRVSVKALIFDAQGRLLVFKDDKGKYEFPGGGWDHDEDHEACLARELNEEVGAKVDGIGPLAFFYRGESELGHPKLFLAFPVEILTADLTPRESDLVEVRFVTKSQFRHLPFQKSGESPIQDYANQIWALIEKPATKS